MANATMFALLAHLKGLLAQMIVLTVDLISLDLSPATT